MPVVRLSPTVSITLGPANASLAAFQNQQFTATVLGASNPAAAWSISPAVGTITSGGLYTAPATITSAQNITVKATSVADSSKAATAVVALKPVVAIALGPANVTLAHSQSQQFTATVMGASNTVYHGRLARKWARFLLAAYTLPRRESSKRRM